MNSPIRLVLTTIATIGVCCLLALSFTACNTTPATIAYKGEVATDASVRSAMIGWGGYVALKHPGTNDEQRVKNAFNLYKQAQLTLIDATAALASNPTNATPVQAAQNVVAAAQVNLVNLISALTA